MSEPYPAASTQQPRRITRLARKPIKLASSAIRPLRSSSSTSGGVGGPSGAAAAGMGSGGTLNASGSSGNGSSSGGGSLEAPSSGSSSLNPLKRITSRSRNRESLAPGANANANAIESGAELDGTAIVKSVRGPRKPLDGEEPAAVVRVRVVKADGLVARDRNGSSDPYVSPFSSRPLEENEREELVGEGSSQGEASGEACGSGGDRQLPYAREESCRSVQLQGKLHEGEAPEVDESRRRDYARGMGDGVGARLQSRRRHLASRREKDSCRQGR